APARPEHATTLAVRPEQLKLVPPGAPVLDRNALPARVVEARFAGNLMHCDVVLADGATLLVETSPDDPLARAGADVQIAWSYDRCALLEDDT
ncbi:MAG TPA: TOBE domain-containing protein, partial [Candidatus Sulfotelmatobacter sp.]|nr:TOBE domain-containing protein [Candidatus Sulfotelmatobacter sp.]